MDFAIDLPDEYPYILMCVCAIAFECWLTGFLVAGRTRLNIFTDKFMEQFKDEHQKAFGESVSFPKNGLPDTGHGRFADKLTYSQWLDFNHAQRVHYNFVEQVVPMIVGTLLAGLVYPEFALYCGIT